MVAGGYSARTCRRKISTVVAFAPRKMSLSCYFLLPTRIVAATRFPALQKDPSDQDLVRVFEVGQLVRFLSSLFGGTAYSTSFSIVVVME